MGTKGLPGLGAAWLLAVLALSGATAHARKIAISAGGDCIDNRPGQGFFKSESDFMLETFNGMGWETRSEFRDDSSGTMISRRGLFEKIGYRERRDDEGRLRVEPSAENDLGAGDQVFLHINTHGSMESRTIDGRPIEHGICIGGDYMPISKLKQALADLSARGVKVAVMDSSCYSGASVRALAGPGVCVMSGTTDNMTNNPGDLNVPMFARLAQTKIADPAVRDRIFESFRSDRKLSAAERAEADKVQLLRSIYDGKGFDQATRASLRAEYQRKHGSLPSEEVYQEMVRRADLKREGLFTKAQLKSLSKVDTDILDADGQTSVEELFLAARNEPSFAGRPAQISSDVGGGGHELDKRLWPLASGLNFSSSGSDMTALREQIDEAFAGACALPTLLDEFEERFAGLGEAMSGVNAIIKPLGFKSVAALRAKMREFVTKRKRLYDQVVEAAREYNEELEAPVVNVKSLRGRKAKLDKLQLSFNKMAVSYDVARLEKAFYATQYLQQRGSTRNDPKARACSEFKF